MHQNKGNTKNMELNDLVVLEMLSFIYEDMDIDAIEEKFIELTFKVFSFDKVGLFFLKHKKGTLQGKLCRGFSSGTISAVEIPIDENCVLTKPLVTGFPLWNELHGDDPWFSEMGLNNFAVIPIINKKRLSCQQLKDCSAEDCPAYGKKWLRCWLVPKTKCHDGRELSTCRKMQLCKKCEIFANLTKDIDSVEGVLLIDNSDSGKPITDDAIIMLSAVSYAVGNAINNTKLYSKSLQVSMKDELTGLHNRRYFNERLNDEIERSKRYHEDMSILLVDIDHFKIVNDTYGHPTGDKMLIWLGASLRESFRHNDVVARYGGEEFAILLLNTTKQHAYELADKARSLIEDNSEKGNNGIKLTCSFGVATYGEDAYSFEGLIAKADKALYFAKAQGRNKVCTHQGTDDHPIIKCR
jgi:diguanylate cyclase (GGDEF)-like protein